MTWPEYENQLKRANPELFTAGKIQLSPASLIAQLHRAYLTGHSDGVKFGKEFERAKSGSDDHVNNWLKTILGK